MNERAKSILSAVAAAILILIVVGAVRGATATVVEEAITSDTKRILTTKAGYLEAVRANNPVDTEFYVCLYSNLIDAKGVTWVRDMDAKYGLGDTEMPDSITAEVIQHVGSCE